MTTHSWNKDAARVIDRVIAESGETDLRDAFRTLQAQLPASIDSMWSRADNDGFVDVVDMFSGAGGMSAGFRSLNAIAPIFRQILAIDIDEPANATYERNLGMAPLRRDVHELANDFDVLDQLMLDSGRRRSAPLVLIGCAPCQGFSSHRNSNGGDDPRNGLFVDFARIAVHLGPDFVVIENVPELLTEQNWAVVSKARATLEETGYHVHLSVHNMAEFGVAQERFRALLLASRKPFRPLEGHLARSDFRTVRNAISSLPVIQPGVPDPTDMMHVTAKHRESTIATIRSVPRDGGNRPKLAGPKSLQALALRQGKSAYEDVYGRLRWDKPSITITAFSRNPASGRFVHPDQDRGLSVREAANLQGFPSTFEFLGSFDERFRQVGNAVPPLFGAQLGLAITEALLRPAEAHCGIGINAPLGKSFSRLIPSLKAGSLRLANAAKQPAVNA